MKTPLQFRRRQFLLGLQGATLAIPFLPSLARRGMAAPLTKKFISYKIANGHFGHQWLPSNAALAGPNGLQLVEPNVREMRLADITGPISPLLDAKFDPFRTKMNLMRHIDRMDQSDHNASSILFGWSSAEKASPPAAGWQGQPPSIDQLMAQKVFGGTVRPLNLGLGYASSAWSFSYSVVGGKPVMEPGFHADEAYQKLFATSQVGGISASEATVLRFQGYQKTIVDRVLPHYREVRDNPRISAADRTVLEQHIAHMQTLSQRMNAVAPTACTKPSAPTRWAGNPESVNPGAQANIDLAVAALHCGLTPIVNLYNDPDTLMTEALHGCPGHHAASHDAVGAPHILNAHKWHMTYFANLLKQLDERIDPANGKSLLDNSLVLLSNEIGNQNGTTGNDPNEVDNNHIGLDVQALLVGSCDGAIRTGSYLDYRTDNKRNRWTQYIGTAYNRLLVSCMLAMGLQPQDWEVGGQPGYGDLRGGPFNQTPPDKVVIGDLRSYLPRIKA